LGNSVPGRRHSDSETHSLHSLSYSMHGLDVPPSDASSSLAFADDTAAAAEADADSADAANAAANSDDDTAKLLSTSPSGNRSLLQQQQQVIISFSIYTFILDITHRLMPTRNVIASFFSALPLPRTIMQS
jgi:hypothetical protein